MPFMMGKAPLNKTDHSHPPSAGEERAEVAYSHVKYWFF